VVNGEWTRERWDWGIYGRRTRGAASGVRAVRGWWGDVDVGGWAMRAGAWCFRTSGATGDAKRGGGARARSRRPLMAPRRAVSARLGLEV
jgi:hypothetical protein